MRRTAWDYIWIHERDLDLENIEAQARNLAEMEMSVSVEHDGEFQGPSELKTGGTSTGQRRRGKVVADESSDWGTDGVGVKVWLRRTIIYQLINLEERME
jgi:hypothetical protein